MKNNKAVQVKRTKQGKKAILFNLEKMHLLIYDQWGEKIHGSSASGVEGIALLRQRQ